mmetsp:Transcript_19690/g.62612  ORF Transcript_19690/g.62612 Transcript_19690/m.62612 type:complete len:234 (-) Transcript_19690:226-927(-)
MRLVRLVHQEEVLRVIRAVLLEHADRVVRAARRDQAVQLPPVHAEDGPLVVPAQRRRAPPQRLPPTRLSRAVPHLDREIVAARHHAPPPRLERDGPYGGGVPHPQPLKCLNAAPLLPLSVVLPQLDGVVIAGRRQYLPARVPAHHLHVLPVPLLHIHAVELVPRAGLPDPHGLVTAACGQHGAAGAPGHALDLVLVALEERHHLPLPALALPHGRGGVEARGRQKLSARRPVD